MKTNSELLVYNGPDDLLYGLERQRRFLLKLHTHPMPCPNCGHEQNFFDGLGVLIDDYDYHKPPEGERFECRNCHRELRHYVPFVSMGGPGWFWGLVPIEVESDFTDVPSGYGDVP